MSRELVEKIMFNFLVGQYCNGDPISFDNDARGLNDKIVKPDGITNLEELIQHGVECLERNIQEAKDYFKGRVEFIKRHNKKCEEKGIEEVSRTRLCARCDSMVFDMERCYESKDGKGTYVYKTKCYDILFQVPNYRKGLEERYRLYEPNCEKRIDESLIEYFENPLAVHEDYDANEMYVDHLVYKTMTDILPARIAFGGDTDTGDFEEDLREYINNKLSTLQSQ